jgi:glycerol-3-phosphate acyltransferase PlsY
MTIMDPLIAIGAALVGYLSGSVSYARVVAWIADPDRKITRIKVAIPGDSGFIESDVVSATTVRLQYGAKYGGMVALLDMLKAAIPMLIFKLFFPDTYYFLIASVMAVVGHIWPVYYRFKGGRGLSSVLGSFFVLDWLGTLVTNLLGFLVGFRGRNMLVITGAGILLMIPWIVIRTRSVVVVAYVVIMNFLYWYSMIPELREYKRLKDEGHLSAFRNARSLRVVLEDGSERLDTSTLGNMIEKVNSIFGKNNTRS